MKQLLTLILILCSFYATAQTPTKYGNFHLSYGKTVPIYYDSVKQRAYYMRTAKSKWHFSKKDTKKIMKGKLNKSL